MAKALAVGQIWRSKGRPRCVEVTGITPPGIACVRACMPDGSPRTASTQRRRQWFMQPTDFANFVLLNPVLAQVPKSDGPEA